MPKSLRAARKAERKAERRRLRIKDRASVVTAIVQVVREAREDGRAVTHWTFEGMLIALLRSEMCLSSVPWAAADSAAREVVAEALGRLGAKRPSWQEGQPEWTDGGVIRDTRITCANCGKGLEPEQKIYCSRICGDAALHRRAWHDMAEEKRLRLNLIRKRRKQNAPA